MNAPEPGGGPPPADTRAVDADERADDRPVAPASPDGFRLSGEPPRVMRLSRKALAIIGIVAGLGIGGSLIYALQPKTQAPPQNLYDTESRNRSDIVTAATANYGDVPKLGPRLPGALGRSIVTAQQADQNVAVPASGSSAAGGAHPPDPRIAAAAQMRERAAQERDSARTSRLFLASEAGTPDNPVPSASALPGTAGPTDATPGPLDTAATRRRAFLQGHGNPSTESAERITRPASRYVVQAGSIIPAALITGIRSDLPGQIIAQVTQNVYDSRTGRILLIPQGARLIGEYDSEVAAGQKRVLLAWTRLILPGGDSIFLDRLPGADAAGMAGLQDRTNYHWGNMLKAALISTLLGTGSELVADDDSDLVRALRYGTQDTVSQTGRQLVQRQLNVPPTLTVRPGFALRIIVTRDLVLNPIEGRSLR